jgi:AraC family transcriptional regulator
VNTPAIIALLAQGRDSQPVKRPKGRAEYTESVAFQTRNDDEAWKPWAEPNREHHDLTLRFCTFDCDILQDDNYQFHTQKSLSSIYLVCLDEHPRLPIGGFRTLNIYVPEPSLGDIVESGDSVSSAAPTGSIDPRAVPDWQLRRLEVEMLAEMRMARPLSRLRIDTLGLEVAVHLLRQHSSMNGAVRWESLGPRRSRFDPAVGRAIEYMESRWADDIRLVDVARAAQLSPRKLTTLVAKATGLPPHRWLMRRRIERACEMLLDPRRSITEVAFACGFHSSQHFATRFRKQIGCTPSAYRRERLS